MKTFLFVTILLSNHLISQNHLFENECHYYFDYSNSTDWTQIGSLVEISNNKVNFVNGAPDGSASSTSVGIQRRLYYELGTTFNSNDTWTVEFDFTPSEHGTHGNGNDHTGHNLFSITETTNDPFNDCIDLPCTGFPLGTQDAVCLVYSSSNPPTGEVFFSIRAKDEGNETGSNIILSNSTGVTYYLRLVRNSPTNIDLEIYSDASRTIHIQDSPVSFSIPPTIEGLTTIQHGNIVRGQVERELTGSIDNLCLIQNNILSLNEIVPQEKTIVASYNYLGVEVIDLTNYKGYLLNLYSDGTVERVFYVN